MGNDYYNRIDFLRALALQEHYPMDCIQSFKEYTEKYPNDYESYIYYACSLITCGNALEAKKVLDEVVKSVEYDKSFKSNSFKYNKFLNSLLFARMKLLSYLGEYEEVNKLYKEHYDYFRKMEMGLSHLNYYCKKKMGIPITLREDRPYAYMYRQIYDYSEELFLEHIKKHLADYNADCKLPNENVFTSDFPIDRVIEEVKKYIPSEKGLFMGFFEDDYIFQYDNCGRDKNRVVDRFKVICFHDTDEIFTMCPVFGYDGYPSVDLNYLRNEKTKKRNMIDRFNSRYIRCSK